MKYVNKVTNDSGEILAIILRSEHKSEGIEFFTPDEFPQQLGYMFHKKGHKVKPHMHNKVKRQVSYTFEVLFIKSGKVRVDFYNDNKTFLKSDTLNSGDVILLAFGAHGFEMLEDAEMIEVKQGPYAGDDDKTRFDPE
jgi:mannose-6-phosphate isomerase-like protein (cupin superfamily)